MTLFDVKSPVLHAVKGQVELAQQLFELEYIGKGGMLVRSDFAIAVGTEFKMIRMAIPGYPVDLYASGTVVGNFLGLCAIMLLELSPEFEDFLDEKYPGGESGEL